MAPALDARKTSGASNTDQESLVEALLEGMGDGFFAVDRDWRLTAFNSAAEADLRRAARGHCWRIALGRLRPALRGPNSTDGAALAWRSAQRTNSRAIRRCAPTAITRCEPFHLAMALGSRFATSPIAGKTRSGSTWPGVRACPRSAHRRRRRVGSGSVARISQPALSRISAPSWLAR